MTLSTDWHLSPFYYLFLADIELSSVGLDGKLYILSKTRKLYLCFNKEGRLVTKVIFNSVICHTNRVRKHNS